MRHFSGSARLGLAASVLVCLAVAGTASAQTTSIDYARTYGSPDNRAIIDFSTALNGVADTQLDLYAGSLDLTLSNFTPSQTVGYCIHIGGVLGTNPVVPYTATIRNMSELTPGNPSPVSTSIRGQGAAWLFNNTPIVDNRDSAALQIAIWESLYDWNGTPFATLAGGNIDISPGAGNVSYQHTPNVGTATPFTDPDPVVTADIRARANAILLTWGGQLSDATWLDTNDVTGNDQPPAGRIRQDLITIREVAPEPGTFSLLAFAVVPLVARLRRRPAR